MTNTTAVLGMGGKRIAVGTRVESHDVHAAGYGLSGRVLRITGDKIVISVTVECPRTYDMVEREYGNLTPARCEVIG